MPWIELHSNPREHPKTASVVEQMGLADADHAVGKLTRLWLWALEYAPDGHLDRFSCKQVAVASGVDPKDGERWVQSLISARLLDDSPRLRIHDWWDYAGFFLRKRYEKTPEKWMRVHDLYRSEMQPDRSGTAAEP